ncbi:hypothetical protein [Nocardia macrotermitis]|uniref:Uncharacterized protein n=1 Tax=Nocardia macrotermitis TaxID=2585198 RepID=A0A7K0D7Z9_9NOCA|nr:hypothetical protein [Nocardia macrotermitis]MQY21920.1 hypothetical protein [Nocardia macrotermitis]
MPEMDDIGAETASIMKQMLQLATLVALRSRERGQKEAEARVKVTESRVKEARELQLREAREAKAKDPRNLELSRMFDKAPLERGVSLQRDRMPERTGSSTAPVGGQTSSPGVRYDSAERRAALAQHLNRVGVAPELAAVRMLMEVGQAQPASEAVRARPDTARRIGQARELEGRGLERTRG